MANLKNKAAILAAAAILLSSGASAASASTYGIQIKTIGCAANQVSPDSACTPGAILTTDTSVICKSGYTKTVRDVPLSEKKQVFREYGIPWSRHGNYEVDHLISLEIGGSNTISNLWPESYFIKNGARTKDKFENYLHAQVCGGRMAVQGAQQEIATDWLAHYAGNGSSSGQTVKNPQGNSASSSPASGPEVKKSATGICHEKGTTYYARTIYYTPYDSIDACLAAGGRLPSR